MTDKEAGLVENTDIEFDFWSMPAVFVLEARMPDCMVKDLNTYLDDLRNQADKESLAHSLVGQIAHGEQLNMDPEHEKVREYSKFVTMLGAEYINHFFERTGHSLSKNREVVIDEVWSVHSYAGDYNPIHDHATKTTMGISTTCWTKVPQQILDQPAADSPLYHKYEASGACDGYLAFNYGRNEIMNVERLRPPQSFEVQPEVGKLYIFPSWLSHMVYPFRGEGERRTVASNLNCWEVEEAV